MNTQNNVNLGQLEDHEIVERFLITYSDRSPYTIRNYRQAINRFRKYIAPKKLDEVNWQEIEDFKLALMKGEVGNGPQSVASVAIQLASIRSLYKWGNDPNIRLLKNNPTTCVKLPKNHSTSKHRYLTKRELSRLLSALKEQNQRNYVMGFMMVVLGVRVSELVDVKWDDFYYDMTETNVWLTVRNGKGRKSRDIKVPPALWSEIELYKKNMEKNQHVRSRLFPVSVRQVERIIRKASINAGLQKQVTPHWLRHTNATLALLNGASLQQVQETLGHSEMTTTQRYLHTVEQLKKAASDYVEDSIKELINTK